MNVSSVQSGMPLNGFDRAVVQPAGVAQQAPAAAGSELAPTQRALLARDKPIEALPGDRAEPEGHPERSAELTPEQQEEVLELRRRDQEVRAHEAAHTAAAGQYAGGASYTYARGPDGQQYAVGGEVSIDASAESTPEATARKADIIRAAALAPADPSGQDQAVAAAATQMASEARRIIAEAQRAVEDPPGPDVEAAPTSEADTSEAAARAFGSDVLASAAGNNRVRIAKAYALAGSGGPKVASLACPACAATH